MLFLTVMAVVQSLLLVAILYALRKLRKQMANTLDDVLKDVADESTQIDSLSVLTAGIKKQLDDILAGALTPAQQAKVDAVFAAVEANKAKVVAAINANTSVATTPPPATSTP